MTIDSHKRRPARKTHQSQAQPDAPPPRSRKRARNLSLTRDAIARGEAYSASRGTTLSALVEQFLRGLPAPAELDEEDLHPAERRRRDIEYVRVHSTSSLVRELAGLLDDEDIGDQDPRELYREHIWQKYGD